MRTGGRYLGIGAVIAACWFWLWTNFHLVPDPMPVHVGPRGEPDAWATKSLGTALTLTALGPVMLLLSGLACTGLVTLAAREAGERQQILARGINPLLATYLFWLATVIAVGVTASLLGHHRPLGTLLMIGGLVLATGVFIVRLVRLQRRVNAVHPPGEKERRTRFGFYFNPDDPDTLVSLENGMTTTLNLARSGAWAVLAVLLALPLFAVILALLAG